MNRQKVHIVFLATLLSCLYYSLSAQTVRVEPDRTRIYIGEQIKLKVSVIGVPRTVSWLYIPDSVNHFEVVDRSKIDTANNAGSYSYSQTVTITSFDSGRWQFPSLVLRGFNKTTVPFNIDVLPVDVSKLKDYHDIKDIIIVKPGINWLLIAIVLLIIIVIGALIYWYFKKKKHTAILVPKAGKVPLEWALEELSKLRRQPVNTPAEIHDFYKALIGISRIFFNQQFEQQSLYQTTDEWMISLQSLDVDINVKTNFFQVLRLADAVKFAKYLPPATDSSSVIEAAQLMFERATLLHTSLYTKYQPQ